MAKRVQRRRGTTTEHAAFTGHSGETTVDTTKDTVIVHDGATAAGFPLAREDLSNVNLVNLIGVTELNLTDGTAEQVIKTDGSGTISFGTIDVAGATMGALGGDIEGTVANALIRDNKVGITELNVSDGTVGQALITDGSGTLSFGDVLTDPAMGGHISGTTSAAVINQDTITAGMLTTALKNFTIDEFTGVSAQTTFTLSASVGSINALLVYIDGIVQPTTAYALPTTTSIQFITAPPANSIIRCLHLGFQSTVGVPSDGTVTNAKLAANAVTSSKILDGTIVAADLANNAVTDAKIFAQTITEASIAPNTITNISIANSTITGTQILDNSISGDKIQLTGNVANDLMYYNGTDWARTAGWNYDISFIAGYDATLTKQDIVVQKYGEMVMARTGVFEGEVGYIDTVCTGAALICDIEKNGVSIYSTKPEFAVSTSIMTAGVISTAAFVSGDRVTFKVTQIGSTVVGQGVRFMLKCKA
jgi:hypothetical protein